MTMWCHLPTILNRRSGLRIAVLSVLCVVVTTTLIFASFAHATTNVTRTLNFQGRLLRSNGGIVPDGFYNIQFKIYEGGLGNAANNPGGELQWTETYTNNNNGGGVEVKNGYFAASLGSKEQFGTKVNWESDTLWLSMNVAGSADNCTSFGNGPCVADGEMLPMKRISATPYALNAGQLGGKTADNFLQLAQGVQTDATSNTSSIFINKTGSGNLLQLQQATVDVFTITNSGNLTLGSNDHKEITIGTSGTDTAGKDLSLRAGGGGSGDGTDGGDLVLQGGSAGGTNGNGGDIRIDAGAGTGTGAAGTISIGTASASSILIGGSSSNIVIGGNGDSTSGTTTLQAKNSVTISTNGTTRATFSDTSNAVYFGNGVSANEPNDFTIQGTNSSSPTNNGGSLSLQGGSATTGDAHGGNLVLSGGSGSGSGANGLVIIGTPTFATATDDENCYTAGALVSTSCTVAAQSINGSAAIIVGFDTIGQTATLPDPTITTAGRIIYVLAANDTEDFTLSLNSDTTKLTLRKQTSATLMWDGSDWIPTGTTAASSLLTTHDGAGSGANLQVGDGDANSEATLLTLDRSTSAPDTNTPSALPGSMYYNTTLGKVQCYEADGWGNCGASPDIFVSLSPEYSNAVVNALGNGTMSTDVCSDTLNINDGSNSQPTVCGTNETYNFYHWTSAQATAQTRSIYVTYQLPANFKRFISGSTSLLGKTDDNDAKVEYQIFRNTDTGLTACGDMTTVSTGSQTTWQKSTASGDADPANCHFSAGDSVVIRINLTAHNGANTYLSNLNFTYSSN